LPELPCGKWKKLEKGKVQGSRFKVQGSRFKVQGSRCKVQGARQLLGFYPP
jgi:hypothetical protein